MSMGKELKRVIVIVLDGVGAGEAPDAAAYGDVGSNSLANTARAVNGLNLPHMEKIGLGWITGIQGVPPHRAATGAYGKMQPKSAGKDTVCGHWELMGVHLPRPFPTYPNGFPQEVVAEFERRTGCQILGNRPASGTQIIQELGQEHLRTGKPIVYTSADSVFQIAAHEEVIPIQELYRMCVLAREILIGEHAVGRVIARPFIGEHPGDFRRTERRKDYPLQPPSATVMDRLVASGREVYAVGKIDDIFARRGITQSNHTPDNEASTLAMLEYLKEDFSGLLFVNLIEFDMIFGHRNDPQGYAAALERFDAYLPEVIRSMRATDLAIITADHGVDPTTPGSDHSREFVPVLIFGSQVRPNTNLGLRQSLGDVAATISEIFSLEPPSIGKSFLREVIAG